jgi:hypothetical protein
VHRPLGVVRVTAISRIGDGIRGREILPAMGRSDRTIGWHVGARVATPNGFVAEIVKLQERQALIRYLGPHVGPDELLLPYSLLRPATAYDLIQAGIAIAMTKVRENRNARSAG